ALAGLLLLNARLPDGNTLASVAAAALTQKYTPSARSPRFSEQTVISSFVTAALFHDIGYPLAHIADTSRRLNRDRGMVGLNTDIMGTFGRYFPPEWRDIIDQS